MAYGSGTKNTYPLECWVSNWKKSGSPLGHIASSQRELPEPHEAVLWLRGSVDPKKIDEIAMEKEKWSVFFTNSFGCDGASH